MATKEDYLGAINKHQVREFLFSYFKLKNIIGLAGPNINEYISWCKAKGYKDIEIWENTPNVMLHQLAQLKQPVRMRFGNILESDPDRIHTLYDLDYCCTVRHMKEHIAKFNDNFIMTFARRITDKETIATFFEARKEKIVSTIDMINPLKHTIFKTSKSTYIYVPYRDTSNMFCIAKIN